MLPILWNWYGVVDLIQFSTCKEPKVCTNQQTTKIQLGDALAVVGVIKQVWRNLQKHTRCQCYVFIVGRDLFP